MKCVSLYCFVTVGLLLAAPVQAEGPELITYQGVLTDSDGTPITGLHDLTFAMYAESLAAPPGLWTENHDDVDVSGGLFNVILGSRTSFPADFFASEERWLGITVDEEPEMAPRVRMTSVPWAMRAAVADFAISGGGGEADSDWNITGENMHSAVPGNVGVGETAPLVPLHIQSSNLNVTADGLYQEEMAIEGSDAVLGLYSSDGGTWGSGISLGEVSGGALTNKWTIARSTGASSSLRFKFGTDPNYGNNKTLAMIWRDGDNALFRLNSDGTSDGSSFQLEGASDQRGAIQFLDENHNIDAEINYLNSSNPMARSALRFVAGGSNRMYITSAGKVGIGTGVPSAPLDVRRDDGNHIGRLAGSSYGAYGENSATGAWGSLGDVNGGVVAADDAEGTAGWLAMSNCGAQGTYVPTGNYGRLGTLSHGVYGHAGTGSSFAGYFDGRVRIKGNLDIWNATRKILELGEGLDYAEGFNLTDPSTSTPGTVLAIAPGSDGKLTVCKKAYDTRVAGIAAGARGLKSGVRLGVDGFDCDVALAGRVYCNVDATDHGIEAGDLLTTASIPGYAMKATDPEQAQGAILGKAMESLEQGQKGQILVLVTLQ